MSQLTGGQTILVGGQTHGFVCPPTKKFVLNAVSTARLWDTVFAEQWVERISLHGVMKSMPLSIKVQFCPSSAA